MAARWTDATEHSMSGEHSKPKKEVHHVEVRRSGTPGDHVIIHHHTHPDHHPPEHHTTRGDDEMAEHLMQTMGTPNPGEDASQGGAPSPDAGADAGAGAGAPAGAGIPPAAAPAGGA